MSRRSGSERPTSDSYSSYESEEESDGEGAHQSLENLQAHVEGLSKRVERLSEQLESEKEQRQELRTELEEERGRRQTLEHRVGELDARTDLLRLIEENDEMSGEQRSVALVQNLQRAAEQERDRGRDAKASITRNQAERALHHPDVDRTTIYDDMRRAARLVGDEDILSYSGSSGGESRLELNLGAGELPADVTGRSPDSGGR